MSAWIFTVPGEPVGKGRPRAFAMKGAKGVRMFTPAKTQSYEAKVATMALQSKPPHYWPLDGHYSVTVECYFTRPKRLKDGGRVPCAKRPDADNIAKAICDALNGIAFADDAAVWQLAVTKWYAGTDHGPRVQVTVFCIEATT